MQRSTPLSELGELGLLAELERRGLVTGVAHDAAELAGGVVVTQDALVEGVHFRLRWTSWRDLGYKAAAVNLSDLAASAARPEALIVTLAVPTTTALEDVVELYEGLAEAGVPVRGGDTTAASQVVLSVTAIGHSERVPGRAGARPGDALVVTGPLGGSAAGFLCLQEGISSPVVAEHLRPPIRIEEGVALGRTASAMLDLSDGLAADAARLAARSGCRIVIDLERVPVSPGAVALAERLGTDLWQLVAGFGEDYELLATTRDPQGFDEIGRCEEGQGVALRLEGRPLALRGYEHFA